MAVLSIVDVATRFIVFCAADGQTALQTAELILTEWMPYFGVPKLLLSDPHSGFASEVMTCLRQLIGIKVHEKECTESEREGGNSGTVTRGFETSTR
jgi:hypothetical protein